MVGQAQWPSMAQDAQVPPAAAEIQEYPVILDGEVLFEVREGIGSFTPEERAAAIQRRILQVAEDEDIPVESITIKRVGDRDNVSVVQDNRPLVTITKADVGDRLETQEEIAIELAQRIREAITRYRQDRVPQNLLKNTVFAVLTTILTLILAMTYFGQLPPSWFQTQIAYAEFLDWLLARLGLGNVWSSGS
ncbi:hypothetical protein RHI63_05350 [Thermosynechococcus sp. GLH187]|uniref:hypothetical protein n=2 Tax=Thermosynechococcus TaxID=146785 RepID=UPI002877F4FE|nr:MULTISPECIES: hypothetical protein [unclassified Thermosynechococcus]WNC46143.1 hypothetical protein RHI63_05350 [Thermosynechococcus sp. GLH187]WNC48680.1 hypothetical protein RHI71_05350 [Thermosynechococcus sp. GLH333]WNC51213.1 hypothetical protein RHI73_05350 [Thermosynechococcus sp. GLH87]